MIILGESTGIYKKRVVYILLLLYCVLPIFSVSKIYKTTCVCIYILCAYVYIYCVHMYTHTHTDVSPPESRLLSSYHHTNAWWRTQMDSKGRLWPQGIVSEEWRFLSIVQATFCFQDTRMRYVNPLRRQKWDSEGIWGGSSVSSPHHLPSCHAPGMDSTGAQAPCISQFFA